jgi:16S rRNA (adenine1518-N6/adenine1519-N6)-dimethyltransferase
VLFGAEVLVRGHASRADGAADGARAPDPDQAGAGPSRLNVRAAKALGQHFLIDHRVLSTIVEAAELSTTDTVVEVGPGLGILTQELVDRAGAVVAVEVDVELARALGKHLPGRTNLRIVNSSILDFSPEELLTDLAVRGKPPASYKVVANLPYYIAAPTLRHFLEASVRPELMVVMVQKEVGESIAAGPGSMSLLGISVQVYGTPRVVGIVPARCFYPRPKVKSAIVRIDVHPKPALPVEEIPVFFDVVRAGFSSPRKQLRNSLSVGLDVPAAEARRLLEAAGIAPERRPQTLSVSEWAALYREFAGAVSK